VTRYNAHRSTTRLASNQDGQKQKGSLSDFLLAIGIVLFLAVLFSSVISFFSTGRVELNPYAVLFYFFPLLAWAPAVARPGALLTAVALLASFIGTVIMLKVALYIDYWWGALGWALFTLFTYPAISSGSAPSYNWPETRYEEDDDDDSKPYLFERPPHWDAVETYYAWGSYEAMKEDYARD